LPTPTLTIDFYVHTPTHANTTAHSPAECTRPSRFDLSLPARCDDYKRYDDLWTIYLDEVVYQIEKEELKVDKTIVFAVKLA